MASGGQWGRSMRSSTSRDQTSNENIRNEDLEDDKRGDEMEGENSDGDKISSGEEPHEEGLKASVKELKNTIDRLTDTLANVDTKFRVQELRIQALEHRCEALEDQNKKLNERVNHLENIGKLQNIKIDGINEQHNEDLTQEILKLAGAMGSSCQPTDIDGMYRMGRFQDKQTKLRTIMIRFKTKQARHEFFNARFQLKNKKEWSRVWINDDVCDQTRRRREAMRAIAILCRDNQTDCKLRSDSIIIKGKKYWINELEQIPHPYSLEDAKMRVYNGDLYFQSEYAWPSNMAPARVTIDKHTYVTAEHAWNRVKAEANDDMVAAELIKKTPCPYLAKRIGDRIRTTLAWEKCECDVMYEIVQQKASENPEIKAKLLETKNMKLHEATRSTLYGIGAGLHSKHAREGRWPGKDVLGQIWEKVRDDLSIPS